YPNRFRLALAGAFLANKALRIASLLTWKGRVPVALTRRTLGPVSEKVGLMKRTRAMLALAPERLPTRSPIDQPAVHAAQG
ncbi:hypothetical protein ABTD44_21365, partial [Acinetobacter baumannii]